MSESSRETAIPVSYGDGMGRVFCLRCAPGVTAEFPLTIEDIDHWEVCSKCGGFVVDVADETRKCGPPSRAA